MARSAKNKPQSPPVQGALAGPPDDYLHGEQCPDWPCERCAKARVERLVAQGIGEESLCVPMIAARVAKNAARELSFKLWLECILECPSCGDIGAVPGRGGMYFDGQELICGCVGHVSCDDDGAEISVEA